MQQLCCRRPSSCHTPARIRGLDRRNNKRNKKSIYFNDLLEQVRLGHFFPSREAPCCGAECSSCGTKSTTGGRAGGLGQTTERESEKWSATNAHMYLALLWAVEGRKKRAMLRGKKKRGLLLLSGHTLLLLHIYACPRTYLSTHFPLGERCFSFSCSFTSMYTHGPTYIFTSSLSFYLLCRLVHFSLL